MSKEELICLIVSKITENKELQEPCCHVSTHAAQA